MNIDWIWDKTQKILCQTDEYSPRKEIKEFHTQMNLPISPDSDEYNFYSKSCCMNLGLKSQPQLNRHNDECLEIILAQNTQGVRRSKS